MKKQNVVATLGTLALVANLLVPGMAFGQSDDQGGQVTINCPAPGASPAFAATLADVVFDSKTSSPTSTQDSFDAAVASETDLPQNHIIGVSDGRSSNVDGCPENSAGWTVTATATNLTSGPNSIPNTSLRLVTSNEVTTGLLDVLAAADGEEVIYSVADAPGNRHDVNADYLYDDFGRDFTVVNNFFEKQENYQQAWAELDADETAVVMPSGAAFTNTLNGSLEIMNSPTAKNMSVYTGVALMIDDGVAINQAPGTYTGTVTYTLNPL